MKPQTGAPCVACGKGQDVTRIATDRPRPGDSQIVCRSCLGAAMESVGPPADAHTRVCSGAHRADDDGRFAIVAAWPQFSHAGRRRLACVRHLREALDALTPERTTAQ
jgi:hypothetical protein